MKVAEAEALQALARLFGRLLLQEIDESMREELLAPDLSSALAAVGIDVQAHLAGADLDELAAEFLEAFVQPGEDGPLVQSLWVEGSYEGECAVALRGLAKAAGVEFDRAAARGAPHDHLGSILLLWATVRESAPSVAARLETEHLRWAIVPLRRRGSGPGFYAELARVVAGFLDLIAPSPKQVRNDN